MSKLLKSPKNLNRGWSSFTYTRRCPCLYVSLFVMPSFHSSTHRFYYWGANLCIMTNSMYVWTCCLSGPSKGFVECFDMDFLQMVHITKRTSLEYCTLCCLCHPLPSIREEKNYKPLKNIWLDSWFSIYFSWILWFNEQGRDGRKKKYFARKSFQNHLQCFSKTNLQIPCTFK